MNIFKKLLSNVNSDKKGESFTKDIDSDFGKIILLKNKKLIFSRTSTMLAIGMVIDDNENKDEDKTKFLLDTGVIVSFDNFYKREDDFEILTEGDSAIDLQDYLSYIDRCSSFFYGWEIISNNDIRTDSIDSSNYIDSKYLTYYSGIDFITFINTRFGFNFKLKDPNFSQQYQLGDGEIIMLPISLEFSCETGCCVYSTIPDNYKDYVYYLPFVIFYENIYDYPEMISDVIVNEVKKLTQIYYKKFIPEIIKCSTSRVDEFELDPDLADKINSFIVKKI